MEEPLIRTQVQLTKNQARRLKAIAAAKGRSMSDLVREGVDRVLQDEADPSRGERMKRAAGMFGRWSSGTPDLAARHDEHFAEASGPRR